MVISRQFCLQTFHSAQKKKSGCLDFRRELALSVCSSVSHLVEGVFVMIKVKFQAARNNVEKDWQDRRRTY